MAVYQLSVHATHTTGTHVPCSSYTHLEYNDTAHDTLLTWMCDKLQNPLSSVPPVKTLVYPWHAGPSWFLLKMSASLTAPAIHLITSTPASFSSLRNSDQTSMCLVLPPTLQLLARYTAPWLSISRTIGSLTLSPSDSTTFFIYSMSWTQVTPAYVFVLVVDNDTVLSVLLLNIAGAPSRYTMCPKTLHLLLGSLAWSKSKSPLIMTNSWFLTAVPFSIGLKY